MPNGDANFAQGIYLAQMFAQKGTCQCDACQLLRKAADGMTAQFLAGKGPGSDAMAAAARIMQDQVDPSLSAQQ